MPAQPKIPLALRLRVLKESMRWVVGRSNSETIRRLTFLDPQFHPVSQNHPSNPGQEPSPSISLNQSGLPIIPQESLERWNRLFRGTFKKNQETQDIRWSMLVPYLGIGWTHPKSHLRDIVKVALRMAWKNQIQNPLLLQMAHFLWKKAQEYHTLPSKEEAVMEAAFYLEEPLPPFNGDDTSFFETIPTLPLTHQVYLAYLSSSLYLPASIQRHFQHLSQHTLNQGLRDFDHSFDLTWIGWNSLFGNHSLVLNLLKTEGGANQKTTLSDYLKQGVIHEIQSWTSKLKEQQIPEDNTIIAELEKTALVRESDIFLNHSWPIKTKNVSPLHWAIQNQDEWLVVLLIQHGANVESVNTSHVSPRSMLELQDWGIKALALGEQKRLETNLSAGSSLQFKKRI